MGFSMISMSSHLNDLFKMKVHTRYFCENKVYKKMRLKWQKS